VFKELENGVKKNIAKKFEIPFSIVSTIIKNRDIILKSAAEIS